jgi:hypothetical protein
VTGRRAGSEQDAVRTSAFRLPEGCWERFAQHRMNTVSGTWYFSKGLQRPPCPDGLRLKRSLRISVNGSGVLSLIHGIGGGAGCGFRVS